MMPQDAGFPEPTSPPPVRPNANPIAGRIEPPAAPPPRPANGSAPPALSAAPDVGALLRALRRRWLAAAVLSLLLGGAAAGLTWYLMTPAYTGFSVLRVLSADPTPVSGWTRNAPNSAAQSTYLRNSAAQLKSRPVIAGALRQDEVKRLGLEGKIQGGDVTAWMEENIKVEFQDPGEYVTVSLPTNDPGDAVTLVKNLITTYMDQIVYAERDAKAQKVTDLDKIYTDTNTSLTRKRENFKQQADAIIAAGGSPDGNTLTNQQKELLEALHDARVQRGQIALEVVKGKAAVEAWKGRGQVVPKVPELSEARVEAVLQADPVARQTLDRITKYQDYIDDVKRNTDEETAAVRAARAKIRELEPLIAKRRDAIRADLLDRLTPVANTQELEIRQKEMENGIAALTDNLAEVDKAIKKMEAQAEKIGGWNNDLEETRGEMRREEKLLDDIGTEREKLKVELHAAPRVAIYQPADLMKRDVKKQALATAAAPIGVVFLVCMAVAWLDVRQRRVRSAGELAQGLGIRVFGAVPGVPHLERRLATPAGEADLAGHPALESFDAIRTLLLRDDSFEAARVIQVTSAGHGEGKTTLAAHLASSLARAGRKTLLIDGDLRRPSVHQLFELPVQPGLSEVLLGEVEAAEAVQNTTIDGLAVIPAGQFDREVMQALARDGLEGVFEKLREEYDFILIDSHPVLPAADSLLIGQQVDAVLLSVLRDVSQTPQVYAASQKLAALGIRVLGAVVNNADPNEVFSAHAAAPAPARQLAAG